MRRRAHPHEHQGELNIVPYLDIMVNLVMFMLMSMTGFITFQIVNVNLPSIGRGMPNTPKPEKKEPPLNLTVMMSPKGFYVAGTGGTLPPDPGIFKSAATEVKAGQSQPTIPVIGGKDYAYDYDQLKALMVKIKQMNPSVSSYFLAPGKTVKYDAIVKTMDMTRGTPDHLLFPDVAFAAILQ